MKVRPIAALTLPLFLGLAASPLVGQDRAAAAPITLDLLLREPREFTAADLRAAVKTAFDVELPAETDRRAEQYVTAMRGYGAFVKVTGVELFVREPPTPRFMHPRAAAMACRDPAVAAAIREHRGFATVTWTGKIRDRRKARRKVACFGAALLGPDVLAVGFRETDVLVAPTDDLAVRLRTANPLAALTPLRGAAGMLLLATDGKPNRDALEQVIRELAPGMEPAIESEEDGRRLAATIDGVSFALTVRTDETHLEFHPDARSELLVLAEFDASEPRLLRRQERSLIRILRGQAEAHPRQEVLAFALCREAGVRMPAGELRLLDEPNAFEVARARARAPARPIPEDDPAMLAAIEKARRTFDRLRRAFAEDPGSPCFVKFPFSEGGRVEPLWISVQEIGQRDVKGRISSAPTTIDAPDFGSPVEVPIDGLVDWTCEADGEQLGGFSVIVTRARKAKVRAR